MNKKNMFKGFKNPNLKSSDDFNIFLSLYIQHQNQLQEAFNIITVVSMGIIAFVAALLALTPPKPVLVAIITAIICVSFVLEILGLHKFKEKIEYERETLLLMCKKENIEYTRVFLSMPYKLINFSFIALLFVVLFLIIILFYLCYSFMR